MEPNAFFDALADVPNLRSLAFADVEMKQSGNNFEFDGLASPVGDPTDLGDFTEEVARGSFRRFLASNKTNIPFLHEHDPKQLLATTRSGRLKLEEEARGLRTRASVVKTDLSERIKALVDSGDITGMSVGWVVGSRANQRVEFGGAKPHRVITGFKKILDVCTTFDPAYASTEAQFRSLAMQLGSDPESWQQVLMGAYPQLQGQGDDEDGTDDTEPPADEPTPPDGTDVADGNRDESGVVEQRNRSIAARKRALSLYLIETGGVEP